jgi:predicted transcriptional regulator
LHELYAQANEPPPSEQAHREEQVIQIIARKGEMTPSEVARFMRGMSRNEVSIVLEGLANAGALIRVAETRKGTVRYALAP